jgi:hypothetical protein
MWYLGYIVAVLLAVWLIRGFAEPKTFIGFQFMVTLSWSLGFSYVLVLPFDIAWAFCRACDPSVQTCSCLPLDGIEILSVLVPTAYWTTLILGYLMNDLTRTYIESGEHTKCAKFRDALKEVSKFYVPATIVGIILLAVVLATMPEFRDLQTLKLLGRGFFNAISLLILVALLSYGLVEVPRALWNRGNIEGRMRYVKFQVALQSEALQAGRRRLDEALEQVKDTNQQLLRETGKDSEKLKEFMAGILARASSYEIEAAARGSPRAMRPAVHGGNITPPSTEESNTSSRGRFGGFFGGRNGSVAPASTPSSSSTRSAPPSGETVPITRKSLKVVHVKLKKALLNEKRSRSMYEEAVRRALKYQSIYEPSASSPPPGGVGLAPARIERDVESGSRRPERRPEVSKRKGQSQPLPCMQVPTTAPPPSSPQVSKWKGQIQPLLYRVLSVCCIVLSLTIIWCEGTILLDGEPFNLNLSPLSLLIRWMGLGGGGAAVTLVIFVPLFYCAACTYYAFFNLRLCEGYSIHWNRHSDSSSLLFNATYACRFGSALCFNYLKLIHENETGQDGGLGFYRKAPDGSIVTSYFDQTAFGQMDNMPPPFSGDWFDDYVPLIIVLLSGCWYLNLFTVLVGFCCKCIPCLADCATQAFSFDEDFSDTRIEHGAAILVQEKRALADGVPLGSNLQLLATATTGEAPSRVTSRSESPLLPRLLTGRLTSPRSPSDDEEEAARTRNKATARAGRNVMRHNRLKDEHL